MPVTVAEFILWALLHWRDPAPEDVARIESFAEATTEAASQARELPFTGPAARAGALVALLVTAHHESGMRPAVVDCVERGDGGRSVTAWQLMGPFGRNGHSVEAVCGSVKLAASSALHVFTLHSKCTPGGMWRAYASGDCAKASKAASDMCAAWVHETRRIGIVGASCDARKPLEWSAPMPSVRRRRRRGQ